MVILCRASNIPARYVEGYAKNIYKGVNKIINKDAHAWVEVYTDELGWVTFDPTPGHISISDYLPNYLFSLEEKDKENEEKKKETKTEKDNIEKRPTQRPTDIKEEKRVIVPKYVYLAFIILFIYLLCYGVFVVKADKVSRIMNKIIYYGKINRVTYDRNMTIREYLEKLEGVLLVDLSKVKDILDSTLYGNKRISNYELNILNRKLKLIKQKTKEKAKIKYYFKNIPYISLEPFYYLFEYLIKNVI
ncbi:hypothetical protein TCEA9_12860 [Thermobrachium celere]|nr:hypothetical protein TCEA9_12860 [Thermobrachium celere]